MDPDGNRLQNSCSLHGRVPPVSGTIFCSLLPSGSIAPSPDTTTPLLARYFLIKTWLPGNRLQLLLNLYSVYYYADVSKSELVQCVYSVLYVQCMCSFHVQYVQAFI